MAYASRERNKKVVDSLTLQSPTDEQGARMDAVRKAAQAYAKVVVKNTASGLESTLAQRHIEDANQRAIRSILFEPLEDAVEAPAAPVKKAVKKASKRIVVA
jgi:hypothetical protein